MQESFRTCDVVIPTIGENARLERLFASLQSQSVPVRDVVVVAQCDEEFLKPAVSGTSLTVRVVHSPRGVSRARNAGLAHLRDGCDAVFFADDDIWLQEDAVERALDAHRLGYAAVSGQLINVNGAGRLAFGSEPVSLNRQSVWTSAIEATVFYRRSYFETVGRFAEDLGLGAASGWGSGEGTDLLLRGLDRQLQIAYDPAVIVFEEGARELPLRQRLQRSRSYARGTGRVYAVHYDPGAQLRFAIRSLARILVGLRRLSLQRTLEDIAVLGGRLRGLLDRS